MIMLRCPYICFLDSSSRYHPQIICKKKRKRKFSFSQKLAKNQVMFIQFINTLSIKKEISHHPVFTFVLLQHWFSDKKVVEHENGHSVKTNDDKESFCMYEE